jgi:hypothetical protein
MIGVHVLLKESIRRWTVEGEKIIRNPEKDHVPSKATAQVGQDLVPGIARLEDDQKAARIAQGKLTMRV